MANATLCPILNRFYTVLLLICFFALKIKIIPHKQNLPKISWCAGWLLLGFLNQNPFKKATKTAVLSSFEKSDVVNVGVKSQISKTKDDINF